MMSLLSSIFDPQLVTGVVFFQVALGLQGCHAARSRSGHGLPVGVILNVTGGKNPRNGSLRCTRLHFDVFVRLKVELPFKKRCVRLMANSDENAVDLDLPTRICLVVSQTSRLDFPLSWIQDVLDGGVPHEIDLGIFEGPLLQDFGRSQGTAAVHHANSSAQGGKVAGLFDWRIASS